MSTISTITEETLTLAPFAVTTVVNCVEKDKKTNKYSFNQDKASKFGKKAGISTLVGSALSIIHEAEEEHTLDTLAVYQESLSEEDIYRLEQLIASRETEFTVAGVTYDLTQVDPSQETVEKQDNKVYQKKI